MKIAQIAPLAESVPPRLYGGTERIVSYLTEELVRAGPRRHAVRQRRFDDQRPAGAAAPPTALRLNPAVRDPLPHHLLMLEQVRQRARRVRHPALPHRPDAVPAAAHHRHAAR